MRCCYSNEDRLLDSNFVPGTAADASLTFAIRSPGDAAVPPGRHAGPTAGSPGCARSHAGPPPGGARARRAEV